MEWGGGEVGEEVLEGVRGGGGLKGFAGWVCGRAGRDLLDAQ